jgi:hypothetical protein
MFRWLATTHVGVTQAREDLRLAQQARAALGTRERIAAHQLEGDLAIEELVVSEIHHAHPARAQLARHAVAPDAFRWRRARHRRADDVAALATRVRSDRSMRRISVA